MDQGSMFCTFPVPTATKICRFLVTLFACGLDGANFTTVKIIVFFVSRYENLDELFMHFGPLNQFG